MYKFSSVTVQVWQQREFHGDQNIRKFNADPLIVRPADLNVNYERVREFMFDAKSLFAEQDQYNLDDAEVERRACYRAKQKHLRLRMVSIWNINEHQM